MQRVRDLGLHERVYLLAGVGPLKGWKTAEFMRTRVPGVVIPDAIVERLKKTPKERVQEEGMQICVEIIEQVTRWRESTVSTSWLIAKRKWSPKLSAGRVCFPNYARIAPRRGKRSGWSSTAP